MVNRLMNLNISNIILAFLLFFHLACGILASEDDDKNIEQLEENLNPSIEDSNTEEISNNITLMITKNFQSSPTFIFDLVIEKNFEFKILEIKASNAENDISEVLLSEDILYSDGNIKTVSGNELPDLLSIRGTDLIRFHQDIRKISFYEEHKITYVSFMFSTIEGTIFTKRLDLAEDCKDETNSIETDCLSSLGGVD